MAILNLLISVLPKCLVRKLQTHFVELRSIYVRVKAFNDLAPEMITGTGHDHTLDWWTLGVLIYEMIVGIPPFYNQNKHQMYYLIESGPIRWPTKEKHGFEVSAES